MGLRQAQPLLGANGELRSINGGNGNFIAVFAKESIDSRYEILSAAVGPRGPNAARALCKERLT